MNIRSRPGIYLSLYPALGDRPPAGVGRNGEGRLPPVPPGSPGSDGWCRYNRTGSSFHPHWGRSLCTAASRPAGTVCSAIGRPDQDAPPLVPARVDRLRQRPAGHVILRPGGVKHVGADRPPGTSSWSGGGPGSTRISSVLSPDTLPVYVSPHDEGAELQMTGQVPVHPFTDRQVFTARF